MTINRKYAEPFSAIPPETCTNFQTMLQAAGEGDLALVSGKDEKTGEAVDIVCAVSWDGEYYHFTPFACMVRENPFERFTIEEPLP